MTQTSEEVIRQQQQDAARRRAEEANAATRPKAKLDFDGIRQRTDHYDAIKASKPAEPGLSLEPNTLPVPAGGNAVGTFVDPHVAVDQFITENEGPGGPPRIKFTKEGTFVLAETGEKIADDIDYVAPVDLMRDGVIKFNGEGEPPSRIAGLPFEGFVVPAKEDLPDRDESQWEPGLSGALEDPWKRNVELPLQRRDTGEIFCFSTMSVTGRGAVSQLVQHYRRMLRTHADHYPVVKLKAGGFESRRKGVGWVHVPRFVVCGRTPRDSAAKPDSSIGTDMDDQIPF